MTDNRPWWTPGRFVPLEADLGPAHSEVERWVPGVNGRIGDPSDELTLAAHTATVRVTVATGNVPRVEIPGDDSLVALVHWFDGYQRRPEGERLPRGPQVRELFREVQ